jgi:predicted Fe-Mo cluster-binding NifX family protein
MKKKIAIPVENGRLTLHFGHCSHFAIVHVENNTIVDTELIAAPPHQPGLLPAWLAERGADMIIAGGIGQRAIDLFRQRNIDVCYGASQKTPEELVHDYLQNRLETDGNKCDH